MIAPTERDRGAVLPIVAMCLVVLMIMSAFTIDLGRQSLRRREVQAATDAIALDLSRLMDGSTADTIRASASWSSVLSDAAARNNIAAANVTARLGHYDATTNTFTEYIGATGGFVPDAVEVTGVDTVDYIFARVIGKTSGSVSRSSVAEQDNEAEYTVGSVLVELDTGDSALLNPIVSGLLGSGVSIGALSYEGLATASASLSELAVAGGFGRVDDLLNANMSLKDFELLEATALSNKGDSTDAAIFNSLATATVNNPTFRIGDLFAAAPDPGSAAEDLQLNLFQMLMNGAELSNGTNFISLNSSIPTITVPNVSNISVSSQYKVIEAPVMGFGEVGSATARTLTSQLDVETTVQFDVTNLSLAGATISGHFTIPVVLTGADAEGDLTRVLCGSPITTSVIDVSVILKALSMAITGTLSTLSLQVLGVPVGTIDVTSNAVLNPVPPSAQTVSDIALQQTKTAPGNNIDFGSILSTGTMTLNASLFGAGLGLDPAAIEAGLISTIDPVLTAVSTALQPTLAALGVTTATADVTNVDVDCGTPKLAA